MNQVVAPICIANLQDLWDVEHGRLTPQEVRRVEIAAIVDAETSSFAAPTWLIEQLGLSRQSDLGPCYDPVRLTILDRDCTMDVIATDNDSPVVIGQAPLFMLDLVVDARNRKLTGNPAHNGEHVLELL